MSQPARRRQENYAAIQPLMLDERHRRVKARKIVAILGHFVGRLAGRRVLDVGCSTGIIADELTRRGCRVLGVDIDSDGVAFARRRFPRARYAVAEGEALPVRARSIDIVVFNQTYEHTVHPERVAAEIHRVLAPGGAAYLGLGNRLKVIEPHYGLPFLSWLAPPIADVYIRAAGKADHYHERFLTRRGLKRLFRDFVLWDYTLTAMAEPDRFGTSDLVGPRLAALVRRVPRAFGKTVHRLLPTYFWIATTRRSVPAGGPTAVAPTLLQTGDGADGA